MLGELASHVLRRRASDCECMLSVQIPASAWVSGTPVANARTKRRGSHAAAKVTEKMSYTTFAKITEQSFFKALIYNL